MNSADSVYDHTKGRAIVGEDPNPEDMGLRYDYKGPFGSTQEALMSQALASLTMPGDVLSAIVRPPLPQIILDPPRFGYRTRQLGLMDVINVNEEYDKPAPRQDVYGQAGAEGTLRNAQGQGFW
jgi:hypothetical protein